MNREWLAALANRDIVCIPILLDDTNPPAIIRDLMYIDLRHNVDAGIQELVQFFIKETGRGPGGQQQQQQQQQHITLRIANRRQIRMVAKRCIDNGALRAYCFDTEIDFAELEGLSLQERLISLLHRLDREQLLSGFAEWLESEKRRCVEVQIVTLSKDPAWQWQQIASEQQQQQP